jgi:integrase
MQPIVEDIPLFILAERYVGRKNLNKTQAVIERYVHELILPEWSNGMCPASSVTQDMAEALHRKLTKRGNTMANRVLEVVSAMFNLAIKRRWVPANYVNPCYGLEWHKERSRSRYLTPVEFPKLRKLLDREREKYPDAVAFVWLMIYTGARPSELIAARWSQVRWDSFGAEIHLPDSKTGEPRTLFVPKQGLPYLQQLKELAGTEPRVFQRRKPPIELWERWRIELGAPDLWLRDLRRTFATAALSNGEAIGVIGGVLGHADVQTTMIYAKLLDDTARNAVGRTAAAIDRLARGRSASRSA